MKLSTESVKVILTHPFETARGRSSSVTAVMVHLQHEGLSGIGQAAQSGYLEQTAEKSLAALEKMAPLLPIDPLQIEETMTVLEERFPDCQAARCAVDTALNDLVGKILGVPLYRYWGLSAGEAKKTIAMRNSAQGRWRFQNPA